MFTLEDRDQVRDHVLRMAASDPRVVAGAVVGSLAHSDGDRFSDLDLTFAVTNDCPIGDVLEDWTTDERDSRRPRLGRTGRPPIERTGALTERGFFVS